MAAFLGQIIVFSAVGFMATIANDIKNAIVWGWQLGHDLLGEPFNEEVDRPVAGFEQASQAPFGDRLGIPAS